MLDDPAFVSAQYSQTEPLRARITLHKRFSTNPTPWMRWLFEQLPFGEYGCVLEVGGGPGELWIENLDRLPAGWTIHLSDLHAAMVYQARRRLAVQDGFTYHLADAQCLPHPTGQFNLVVANHMLYHVADLDRTLAELARVLKPGAFLVAATNGSGHMLELRQLLSRFLPETCFAAESDSNLSEGSRFTLQNGRKWAAKHFQEVEIRSHPNSLQVTELEPLMAYICSRFPGRMTIGEDKLMPMRAHLEKQIAVRGAFEIAKEVGCMIARKG
jgi:ubiquinone/menaquinone biosynthesis C-methylase UbiE